MGVEAKFMEVKNTKTTAADNVKKTQQVQEFVTEVKSEIRKIHWTSRDELITYTKIVIAATLFFGFAIYFVDMLIQGTLGALGYLLRFIAG